MNQSLYVLCALLVSVSFAFALGNTCANPIEVAIPANLEYHSGALTTCGLGYDYDNIGCVPGGFDNGEDAIFRLTVSMRWRIRIVLNTYQPTPHPMVSVHTVCPSDGGCIARAYTDTGYWVELRITLDPGQYYVMVDNWPTPNCLSVFGLDIYGLPPDPGEDCSEAVPINNVLPQTLIGYTCNFEDDLDAACTFTSTARDVVYSYTPPTDADVTFDLCQSNYDTKIFIYDGSCLGTPIACNEDGGVPCNENPFRSYLGCVPLVAGHEYFIVVDGDGTACGNYSLTMTECAPPPGDVCASALSIPGALPQTVTGSTCGFQDDYYGFCGGVSYVPDVVYSFVPATNGWMNLDPCDSQYNVRVWMWDSCQGTVLVCLPYAGGAGSECTNPPHQFAPCIPVTGGQTYYIVVDGWDGQCGNYQLTLSSCPAGEMSHNAIPLPSALPQTVSGNTCGYFNDADLCGSVTSASGDVYYLYHSAADQQVTFDLCGSSYDTKINVLDAQNFALIACSDDEPLYCADQTRSHIECVHLQANTDYLIVVDGSANQCGNYLLNLSRCYTDRPCDVCAPPDVTLASIPETACGASISGNCGWQGKWVAEFQGIAGYTYHWDLCPDPPCNGTANFDPDIKICDANCQILTGADGLCMIGEYFVPNDFQWICPTDGVYYVIVSEWQSFNGHNCPADAADEFTMVYWAQPPRACESCTPVDASLGDITTVECGTSISGNLGYGGKWVAEFQGVAGAAYHWDLCPADPCPGHAEEGSNPADLDFVILDANCSFVEWYDGEDWCDWRPNDHQWICPANGTYYVLIAPWPAWSLENNQLTCSGNSQITFTLVYYREAAPILPGERCDDAPLLPVDLPQTLTGNTCSHGNDWDASCVQNTDVGGRDIVYAYAPTADMFMNISICDATFDPKLFVFDNICQGDPYVCNDRLSGMCAEPWDPYLSCVQLFAGHVYYIVVDAVNEMECGDYTLTLESCSPIPGDVIETAFPVVSLPFAGSGTTEGFFDQYAEECNGRSNASDVVYAYSPPGDVTVEIDLCNSCFDDRLYVYENSRNNMVACDDNGCWPSYRGYIASVPMFAGNTYFIVVDGDYDARGTYQLDILERAVGRCCQLDGGCAENITSRECAYYHSRGDWTPNADCGTPCTPVAPPPGPIQVAAAPVVNGCNYGITMAADCGGHLYYNNTCSETLYTTDALGTLLGAIAVTRDGNPAWFDLCGWDKDRHLLWGNIPPDVGLIDPATGVFTTKFITPIPPTWMAFNPADKTLWAAHWACCYLSHFDTTGALLGTMIPRDAAGNYDCVIRGVAIGPENSLYLAHADGRITRVEMANGDFVELFAVSHDSSGAALACDGFSYAPQTVLWWKFNASFAAYALEDQLCVCACPPVTDLTAKLNAAHTNMILHFTVPSAGVYKIYGSSSKTAVYPATFVELTQVTIPAGAFSWTDPEALSEYRRYVVVHLCP